MSLKERRKREREGENERLAFLTLVMCLFLSLWLMFHTWLCPLPHLRVKAQKYATVLSWPLFQGRVKPHRSGPYRHRYGPQRWRQLPMRERLHPKVELKVSWEPPPSPSSTPLDHLAELEPRQWCSWAQLAQPCSVMCPSHPSPQFLLCLKLKFISAPQRLTRRSLDVFICSLLQCGHTDKLSSFCFMSPLSCL